MPKHIATFLLAIVDHTLAFYHSTRTRSGEDYIARSEKKGKIDTQIYPNLPILKERAFHERKCKSEDRKAFHGMCRQNFDKHRTLTPGLLTVTCACPQKVVYGFSMMMSGESPQMIFDLIMSRFAEDYNPHMSRSRLAVVYGGQKGQNVNCL